MSLILWKLNFTGTRMTSEQGGLFAPSVFPSPLILTQNTASPPWSSRASVSSSVNTEGPILGGPESASGLHGLSSLSCWLTM